MYVDMLMFVEGRRCAANEACGTHTQCRPYLQDRESIYLCVKSYTFPYRDQGGKYLYTTTHTPPHIKYSLYILLIFRQGTYFVHIRMYIHFTSIECTYIICQKTPTPKCMMFSKYGMRKHGKHLYSINNHEYTTKALMKLSAIICLRIS